MARKEREVSWPLRGDWLTEPKVCDRYESISVFRFVVRLMYILWV